MPPYVAEPQQSVIYQKVETLSIRVLLCGHRPQAHRGCSVEGRSQQEGHGVGD